MEWPAVADLIHRGPWYKNRGIVMLNLCLALSLITSYTSGFDGSSTNGLQIVPGWQNYFNNPNPNVLGIITSVQNIGSLIALPFAPYASDVFGRKRALFMGACIMCGGVALQTISSTIVHFIIARGLIGLGLCFAANAAPLLVIELAYPTQRGPVTAMYNSSWYLGSIIAAWVTFGTFRMNNTTWSWRIPSVLQGLPSILQVCFVWFVPESPRWLVSKGKDTEAIRVLAKYHANGNELDPLIQFEYNEIREALLLEKEIAKRTTYLSLFATPGNRRRMRIIIALGFFSQWSGNGLVSYYINLILATLGITSPALKTLINGCLQIWNLIMAVSASLLVDKVGRRPLFLISNAGMLLSFAAWTVSAALYQKNGNSAAANATIAMIFVYYSFYDIAYTPLLVAYTIEILPFNIRAKGFAVMSLTIAITLVFNQYVNPVALERLHWKYYLVYCVWLLFEFVFVYFFLYETKGRTLEQTAALFDGTEHAEALQNVGREAAGQAQLQAAHELTHRPRRSRTQREHEVHFSTSSDRPSTGTTRPGTGDSRKEDYYYDRSLYGETKDDIPLADVPEDREVGPGYYYTRRPVRY